MYDADRSLPTENHPVFKLVSANLGTVMTMTAKDIKKSVRAPSKRRENNLVFNKAVLLLYREDTHQREAPA
tara:strand:- start:135 stop:347 length:213 start_codon:yes stop_codon:yes gene_type:complete